jgi:hypothetical protein
MDRSVNKALGDFRDTILQITIEIPTATLTMTWKVKDRRRKEIFKRHCHWRHGTCRRQGTMHHQGAFVAIAQNHVINGQTCACIFCHFSCLWLDMPQGPQVGPDPRILRRPLTHRMARRKPHVTLRPQGFARMF